MAKMTKTQLKEILKPLIKECIRESIFEDGVLSSIITEVTLGVQSAKSPTPPAPPTDPALQRMQRNAFQESKNSNVEQGKAKLMAAIGGSSYNGVDLFEGTTPAAPNRPAIQQAKPLAGQAPADAGVDIGSILGAVGKNWNAHMSDIKEGK